MAMKDAALAPPEVNVAEWLFRPFVED